MQYRRLGRPLRPASGSGATFNLDGIGIVDNDDVTAWLSLASAADPPGRTFVRGDANLDGIVGGSDFTALAVNFGQPGGWAQGNFVVASLAGGGDVGGNDFTALALNFGFTSAEAVRQRTPCPSMALATSLIGVLPAKTPTSQYPGNSPGWIGSSPHVRRTSAGDRQ